MRWIIERLIARAMRTDVDIWIDQFARVYAEHGGPRPFEWPRRRGESVSDYRARFEAWLFMPSSGTSAAQRFQHETTRA
jgi:hypothetical protein